MKNLIIIIVCCAPLFAFAQKQQVPAHISKAVVSTSVADHCECVQNKAVKFESRFNNKEEWKNIKRRLAAWSKANPPTKADLKGRDLLAKSTFCITLSTSWGPVMRCFYTYSYCDFFLNYYATPWGDVLVFCYDYPSGW